MGLKDYDAEEVRVIFGTRELRGKAPDTFVRVGRVADSFSEQVGADGEVTRSSSRNKLGMVVVTLQQASPDNAFLQASVNADEANGTGLKPIQVVDRKGSFIGSGLSAWVKKPADNEFGSESGTREWTIMVAELLLLGGGNKVVTG